MTSLDAYAVFLTARWDEIEQAARALHNTPAYVLADLASKRAILDDAMHDHRNLADQQACPRGGSLNMLYLLEVRNDVNRLTLAHLAAPFRDHPDHPANQEQAVHT